MKLLSLARSGPEPPRMVMLKMKRSPCAVEAPRVELISRIKAVTSTRWFAGHVSTVCRVYNGAASDGILYMLWSTGVIFEAFRSIISFKGLLMKQGFSFAKEILLASHTVLYRKSARPRHISSCR